MHLEPVTRVTMPSRSSDRYKELSDDQAVMIDRLIGVMDAFAKVDGAMPSSYIRMFLKVMRQPGKGISEYANDIQAAQAVGSRILLEIGPKARTGGKGLELVEAEMSPTDMRTKHYYMTTKGRKVFTEIMRAMGSPEVPY